MNITARNPVPRIAGTSPAAKNPVNKPKSEGSESNPSPSGGSNVGVMDLNDI